jgi:hypothetical protein
MVLYRERYLACRPAPAGGPPSTCRRCGAASPINTCRCRRLVYRSVVRDVLASSWRPPTVRMPRRRQSTDDRKTDTATAVRDTGSKSARRGTRCMTRGSILEVSPPAAAGWQQRRSGLTNVRGDCYLFFPLYSARQRKWKLFPHAERVNPLNS